MSYGSWKRLLGGDAGVVGRTVVLNGHVVTIIGIADARCHVADPSDFYLPLALQPVVLNQGDWLRDPEQHWLMVEARLRLGVSARQAQAEVDALSSALGRTEPGRGVLITPGGGNPEKRRELAGLALAVTLAVSMILLIACFNLANLLLARAVVRRREIGVRLSLGASRARVICQLLTESMLLSFAGAGLGLLLSHWLAASLVVLLNPLPGFELRLDPLVILYCIALACATGLSFGLAPALAATRTDLARALHSEGLSEAPRSRSGRIWSPRNALVIAPLAVSLMLLIGAGMTVRLVQRMYLGGPTFDTAGLIGISFRLNLQGYDETRTHQFQEDLRERIGMMSGVTSVALASAMPLVNGMGWFPFLAEGSTISPGRSSPHADYNIVSAAFFETIGASVVLGRAFNTADREGSPPVAIVNQALVRRYWSNGEPIGRRIRLATGSAFFEIIGVAPDLQDPNGPFNSVRPTVYIPFGQGKLFLKGTRTPVPPYQMQFLIRTSDESANVKGALRREALAIDSSLRVNVQTLEEVMEARLGPIKTTSMVLTALGALALIMASVGIYGILAYATSQRTREIGIRMALGARRQEILALVMQRTLMLIAWGIGLGLIGALTLNRILSSAVAGVGGLDAVTCTLVVLLQGAVAILASYLPARKALLVDPVQALHCE